MEVFFNFQKKKTRRATLVKPSVLLVSKPPTFGEPQIFSGFAVDFVTTLLASDFFAPRLWRRRGGCG